MDEFEKFEEWFKKTYPDAEVGEFNYTDSDLLGCWGAAIEAFIEYQASITAKWRQTANKAINEYV